MQINLQGKNLELTDEIKEYVNKRILTLDKLFSRDGQSQAVADFEIERTTNHHKAGDVFRAGCKISAGEETFFSESENAAVMSAIDEVKDKLFHEITRKKDKKQTLYKRGGASVKKMLKGLSKRNPFTSKY